jgi:dipeptidase D
MSESVIQGLNPELIWKRFYEITRIPRPSKKEEKIREHLRSFFKRQNVSFKEDKTGNIIAKIQSTPGYENSPTVILQGHIDMVCEKNKETKHDFDKDPIEIKREDGWIKAIGTTLGSDNGIGVSAALAVVNDQEVIHGPIEILLTVDEETSMTGASYFDADLLNGRVLLNLDSEEDGAFYVGCSGGVDSLGSFPLTTMKIPSGYSPYEIMVTGLKGGHSGLEINQGRANAIKLMGRILNFISDNNYYLASISGGSLRNAIPRECEVLILVKNGQESEIEKKIAEFEKNLVNEFKKSDGGLKVICRRSGKKPRKVFSTKLKKNMINLILALPHGVIEMSQDIPDLVETSTNLAVISTDRNRITISTSQRSSIESAKDYIAAQVKAVMEMAGGSVIQTDGYPGWKPDMSSSILKTSREVFRNLFNKDPEIKAVHAGLECGLLGAKIPELDIISFGPTIIGAHSPDERVEIETVGKFYDLLRGILKRIAEQK